MSVMEFLGAFFPWPASKRLDDIKLCKSRLILQANALRTAINADPWERMLAHACDRGAAEWEHWLLTNAGEPPHEQELTAHSALTLAQRSGDWELVRTILDTWKKVGESHKRCYRDAEKAYEKHRPAFLQEEGELIRLARAIHERPDVGDARRLLSLTASYAEHGGAGLALPGRAEAHDVLGEHVQSERADFAACIANPHDDAMAGLWLIRNAAHAELIEPHAETSQRALAWHDGSVIAHAGALCLAFLRRALDGPPPQALIESTLALSRLPEVGDVLVFAVGNVARALASRGELARAEAILADAIPREPTRQGRAVLFELREAIAAQLSEPPGGAASSEKLAKVYDLFAQRVRPPPSLAA